MTEHKKRGGPRQNTGLVQSLELTKEEWRVVRTLCLARYGRANKDDVNKFFRNYVLQEWQAFDEKTQANAEELAEAETCANA